MQTPDAHATPDSAGGTPSGSLTVDALLRRSAQGDRASFSAFYDATVPWVHGMASAMFRSPRDAAEATVRTYLTAWEEAPEAELDLSEQDDASHRERLVFTWLEVLAHRVMTGLLRSPSAPLPDRAGAAEHGDAPLPEDLVGRVEPAAFEAVRAAWLGGATAAGLGASLGVPREEARTRLRDGVRDLVAAHRALGRDLDSPNPPPAPRTASVPLGADVREDLEGGRGAELADLVAVHALETPEHTATLAAVHGRGSGELAVWRSRVDAARRAVTWAFRSVVAEPPSTLLEELLTRLPAQDVGVALVGGEAGPRGTDRRRPLKIALLALLALLVLAVGVWAAWDQFSRPGIAHRVAQADDLYTTSEYPAQHGGTLQGFLSAEQNSGYVTVHGMPQLQPGQAYQVWLHPEDGSAPASLGQFQADEFQDPLTFRGLDRFAALSLTVEPDSGSDVPTSEFLVGVDLDPASHAGPRYGGQPTPRG